MSQAQKRLVLAGVVLYALLLHALACEWKLGLPDPCDRQLLSSYGHLRLCTDSGLGIIASQLVGLFAPLFLLLLAAYLRLQWFPDGMELLRGRRRLAAAGAGLLFSVPALAALDLPVLSRLTYSVLILGSVALFLPSSWFPGHAGPGEGARPSHRTSLRDSSIALAYLVLVIVVAAISEELVG